MADEITHHRGDGQPESPQQKSFTKQKGGSVRSFTELWAKQADEINTSLTQLEQKHQFTDRKEPGWLQGIYRSIRGFDPMPRELRVKKEIDIIKEITTTLKDNASIATEQELQEIKDLIDQTANLIPNALRNKTASRRDQIASREERDKTVDERLPDIAEKLNKYVETFQQRQKIINADVAYINTSKKIQDSVDTLNALKSEISEKFATTIAGHRETIEALAPDIEKKINDYLRQLTKQSDTISDRIKSLQSNLDNINQVHAQWKNHLVRLEDYNNAFKGFKARYEKFSPDYEDFQSAYKDLWKQDQDRLQRGSELNNYAAGKYNTGLEDPDSLKEDRSITRLKDLLTEKDKFYVGFEDIRKKIADDFKLAKANFDKFIADNQELLNRYQEQYSTDRVYREQHNEWDQKQEFWTWHKKVTTDFVTKRQQWETIKKNREFNKTDKEVYSEKFPEYDRLYKEFLDLRKNIGDDIEKTHVIIEKHDLKEKRQEHSAMNNSWRKNLRLEPTKLSKTQFVTGIEGKISQLEERLITPRKLSDQMRAFKETLPAQQEDQKEEAQG